MSRRTPKAWLKTWLAVMAAVVGLVAIACGGNGGARAGDEGPATSQVSESAEGDRSAEGDPAAPSKEEIAALTATVAGGGASFPDAYYQAVNTDFNALAGSELVTYAKSGSSDGRRQLAAGTLDVAGSDSLPKPGESWPSQLLLFPTVAAPITVSYNLDGIEGLRLSPGTLARIFQGEITTWADPAVAADNPDLDVPDGRITVVHRSDGSGTTNNFTSYLSRAAAGEWTLGSGDTVNWPASALGAEKNSGVAAMIEQTAGSIGYVDLADAVKAGLDVASIRNRDGNFVAPGAESTAAAVAGAKVADDLSYDPLDAEGADSYPITAPTYLMVLQEQSDPGKATTLRTYLRHLLTTGQEQAADVGYVGLPEDLRIRAYQQIDRIQG